VRAFLALGLGLGGLTGERRRLEGWLEGRGDPLHRGAAAIALGLLGDPLALPALARTAVSAPPSLRGDACEAMGLLGGPQAAPALRELAREGSDAQRAAALYALGCLGQPADRDTIAAALDGATPDLRMGGVWGLAAFAGAEARDRLLAHAAREANPQVRALAYFGALLAVADRPLTAMGKDVDRSPWAREH
jgi:HEAT repeat protein